MVKNAAKKRRIREIMSERGVNYVVASRINDQERSENLSIAEQQRKFAEEQSND